MGERKKGENKEGISCKHKKDGGGKKKDIFREDACFPK